MSLAERVARRIDYQGDDDACWEWRGSRLRHGYGHLKVGSRTRAAHQVAYECLVGPIPDGLILDHLCRNPPCCNPAHLEPVTPRENTLRGDTVAAFHSRKTHCIHGHPFDAENTYRPPSCPNVRMCVTCRRIRQKRYDAERSS